MTKAPAPPQLVFITVDSADPESIAVFWAELLETEIAGRWGGDYVILKPQPGRQVRMAFQRVPEAKQVKNRVHVDLVVEDLDQAMRRVLDLGGALVTEHLDEPGYKWRVMRDPEGNEFCIAVSGEDPV